jgi:hypothetical protein
MIKNIIRFKNIKPYILKPNILKMYCYSHSHSKTVFCKQIDNKTIESINNIELQVNNHLKNMIILQDQINKTHDLLKTLYIINIMSIPVIVLLR